MRRIFMWLMIFIAGVAFLGGVSLVKQMRTPPVANAYYVALGSSYAAGLGLGPRVRGSPIISGRSVNGYPQQLARLLKVPSFTDMSSSGSTLTHVLYGGQLLLGPQIDALGPDTRLVTLTAGGNDVGYVGDLTAMAYANRGGILGTLVGIFWSGAKPLADRKFSELESNLTAILAQIRRRSPRARIVVVTYPAILPDNGTCPELGTSEEQAELMRAVGATLAETTRTAATKAGVTIVDLARLSHGHDACRSDPWVNGFRPKAGADFHPTLAGARATAQAVAATIH